MSKGSGPITIGPNGTFSPEALRSIRTMQRGDTVIKVDARNPSATSAAEQAFAIQGIPVRIEYLDGKKVYVKI